MSTKEQFVAEHGPLSTMEYDDGTVVLVADVGQRPNASVDVVGDTAILVADGEQYEFELPNGAADSAQAFMKNGVLTVEVNE